MVDLEVTYNKILKNYLINYVAIYDHVKLQWTKALLEKISFTLFKNRKMRKHGIHINYPSFVLRLSLTYTNRVEIAQLCPFSLLICHFLFQSSNSADKC